MGSFAKSLLALGGILIHTSMVTASESNTTLNKRSRNDTPCDVYLTQGENSCAGIAKAHSITTADIEKYNSKTYAWNGCDKLRQGDFIYISSRASPMPEALPNAVCGPQVPGTAPPTDPEGWSNLGSLNPCPAGQYCKQGQCQPGANSCGAAVGPAVASTTSTTAAGTTTKTLSTSYTTKRVTVDTSKDSTTKSTTTKRTTTTTTTKDKTATTKSKITTSKWPEKTGGLFSIAIYSSRECSGDYYVVEGPILGTNGKCLGIHSGISSISTGTNTWCKWYFDGGFNSTDCDSGDKLEIGSIHITSGSCNIYNTEDCQSNGKLGGYDSGIYTECHAVDDLAPKTLGGLKCSHNL
ncbi:Peptidoglycan-binding Lysin subgroup [Penicillium waksmanii]|uniref:Peptidoglycan-binding Lysin subgroup n=1 Tax=Penicillium waksmanii TaxID=69791 RepID=UPI002548B415|nr:Peptidoglycan-binding Lysin subgroup [Penicillium waksmanii]KAJ5995563.1 Peptidoglycan-binding Lysin subgroup [Penicillium waksmanii]